jgi:hypothetical protein
VVARDALEVVVVFAPETGHGSRNSGNLFVLTKSSLKAKTNWNAQQLSEYLSLTNFRIFEACAN